MTDLSREAIDEMKHELWRGTMTDQQFIEQVFEIAFGDDAYNKGYYKDEVLGKLKEFSDNALKYENGEHIDYSESNLEYLSKF